MKPYELILKAKKQGITLYLKDGQLAFKARKQGLTAELRKNLAEYKQDIVSFLMKNVPISESLDIHKQARLNGGDLVMSFSQQRLWFINQLEESSSQYNMFTAHILVGTLNVDALEQAFREILHRHKVLTTIYPKDKAEKGLQVILEDWDFSLTVDDARHITEGEKAKWIHQYINQEALAPFDITKDLVLRARLLQLSDKWILTITMHHIASDGLSATIIADELFELYSNYLSDQPVAIPAVDYQYADYAAWQREQLQGQSLDRLLGYWKERLEDIPQTHSLPMDKPRPAQPSNDGKSYTLSINTKLKQQLQDFANERGITLFMLFHAAISAFLARVSGESDIVIGTSTANRDEKELLDIVGFFANTLVLRADLAENPNFSTLLQRSKDYILGAFEHQEVPFDKLVNELKVERQLNQNPIYQIMFNQLDLEQEDEENKRKFPGLTISKYEQSDFSVQCDLSFCLMREGANKGMDLVWEYATELFDSATIEHMAESFERLLLGALANPELLFSELPLLSESEQQQLVTGANQTGRDYPDDLLIYQHFEHQVTLTPNAPALSMDG
ncbi:MAG: hypothetical protein ACJAV1_002828, partial [Paraglaciecola sp.]